MASNARPSAPRAARDNYPAYPQTPLPLLLLFLGYVLFWYLQGGVRFEALGRMRFEFILGSILSVLAVLRLSQQRSEAKTSLPIWTIALLVITGLSVVLSVSPSFSWNIYVDRVIKFMMVALFTSAFVTSPRDLRWFIATYLLAFLKMAQEGITGLITGSMVWENQGVPRLHGSTPNYEHPNSFSGTQLGTLPFLYGIFALVGRNLKILVIAQALMALLIIMYCGSRTAYLGLISWVVLIVVTSKAPWKAAFALIVLVTAVSPMLPPEYKERLASIFTQQDKEGHSIDTRKEILRDAWSIFESHPLGVGAGAFPIIRDKTFGRMQDTHNLYLEVLTNLGVQGAIVFIGFVFAVLGQLSKLIQRVRSDITRIQAFEAPTTSADLRLDRAVEHLRDLNLIVCIASAVRAFLIIRLVLGLFGHDLYEIYWWFSAGLTIALTRMFTIARRRTEFIAGVEPTGRKRENYRAMASRA